MSYFLDGFGSFALVIGIVVLFFAWHYLVRGCFIYQDHGNNLGYKERGRRRLSFYIVGRYKDEIYSLENYEGVEIHVPAGERWKIEMPDWAKERRKIILQRLEKDFRGRDKVYFVEYEDADADISVTTLFPPH